MCVSVFACVRVCLHVRMCKCACACMRVRVRVRVTGFCLLRLRRSRPDALKSLDWQCLFIESVWRLGND